MKAKATRILLVVLIITGIALVMAYRDLFDVAALRQWVQSAGVAGPVVFMLLYILGTIFFFPGSVLTLAGGALFGPWSGTLYNLVAATAGSVLSFLMARYLASDWVARKSGHRLQQLAEGVKNEGWRFVAFVRLVPLFPFNLLNYALGLTRIRLSHYMLASFICMFPGALAYTYLGYAGSEAVAGGVGPGRMMQLGILALALLGTVAFLPRIVARLRQGSMISVQTLKQKLEQGSEMLVLDVRSEDEFNGEQGHLLQARNIPLEMLADKLEELSVYLEKPIALICRSQRRSARAAALLTRHGYADVHIVRGGMTDWNNMIC